MKIKTPCQQEGCKATATQRVMRNFTGKAAFVPRHYYFCDACAEKYTKLRKNK